MVKKKTSQENENGSRLWFGGLKMIDVFSFIRSMQYACYMDEKATLV